MLGAVLEVVAAAIVRSGRLLVVSKRSADHVFYLPGGAPEPGEPERETLARELREELGVTWSGPSRSPSSRTSPRWSRCRCG